MKRNRIARGVRFLALSLTAGSFVSVTCAAEISGTVSYGGTQTGTVWIVAESTSNAPNKALSLDGNQDRIEDLPELLDDEGDLSRQGVDAQASRRHEEGQDEDLELHPQELNEVVETQGGGEGEKGLQGLPGGGGKGSGKGEVPPEEPDRHQGRGCCRSGVGQGHGHGVVLRPEDGDGEEEEAGRQDDAHDQGIVAHDLQRLRRRHQQEDEGEG